MAHEGSQFMRRFIDILKGMVFLGFILVAGVAATVGVMLIVPAIDCLIHGTPFFQ